LACKHAIAAIRRTEVPASNGAPIAGAAELGQGDTVASKLGWILVGLVAGLGLWLLTRAANVESPILVALLLAWACTATFLWLRAPADGRRPWRALGPDQGPEPVAPDSEARGPASPPTDLVAVDSLPGAAVLIDPQLKVIAANAAAVQLHERPMVGEDLAVAVRHPLAHEAVQSAVTQGGPVERDLADVGPANALVRLRVADAGQGRLLLSFTDITQARAVERMRADFVANASHELRTPLATILGFIETLQGPAAGDEPARARFLEIMGREARRMARLIDDLMSLSRIELDKYVRPLTPLALPPLLAEVGRTLAMRFQEAGSEYRLDADPALPQVIADRDQILQVMHNLVTNALKYGRAGSPVTVRALFLASGGRTGGTVAVSVTDEGPGVPPEHLPRLTERFYRVDPSRSRQMSGTGLGLSIVKHIVERHRGELRIESELGVGTTVTFSLPVMPAEPQDEPGRVTQQRTREQFHRNETELS
jgi:two-component system phosphate regulon sensor histidine kinase PhoR